MSKSFRFQTSLKHVRGYGSGKSGTALTSGHIYQATGIVVVAAGLGLFFALLSLWVS